MQKHTTEKVGNNIAVKRGWLKVAAASAVALSMVAASAPAARAADANDIIANWPAESQKAAKGIMKIHGMPDETTSSMLVWYNSGPWKRIVATKAVTPHHFPAPHPDSVEQVVSYRIPANKADALTRFDGSLYVDRTRGEMSARCDAEHHNVLALNLAHDIVTGKRSVENARAFYARAVKIEKMQNQLHHYMLRLNFTPPANAGDPGQIMPQLRPMVRQMREQGEK